MSRDPRTNDFDPLQPTLATAGGPQRLRDQPLLRLLAINWLIGAAVAGGLVVVVLVTDTAHLRSLMFASSEPWIPILMLFFGFVVTMCSVAMGTAIMMLPKDDDDHRGGGMKLEVLAPPRLQPAMATGAARGRPGHRPRHRG